MQVASGESGKYPINKIMNIALNIKSIKQYKFLLIEQQI